MLGKASVIKTRNQVKDIPVHQERVFSFITMFYPTKIAKKEGHGKYFRPFLISRSIKSLLGIPPIYYRCYDKITALSPSKEYKCVSFKTPLRFR